MNKTTTLKTLTLFTRNEKQILEEIGLNVPNEGPKQETLDFLLNYSKCLSVRDSRILNKVETILN